ncbi:hypothetical protein CYMTET_43932 [Cymbomonas tetramitiformis]|uniref:Uncharacterized protein n=1 Tax=Cymbomonas tetramitiformis TaxID=36881 RepID=A0AAE0EZT3_9CHLO|nr:hypothetical protein CYMTET_43932 [Cymbomonas tetramitiformis]
MLRPCGRCFGPAEDASAQRKMLRSYVGAPKCWRASHRLVYAHPQCDCRDFWRSSDLLEEVASAAGVDVHYIVADVLKLEEEVLQEEAHAVIMEMGILHYFVDLTPLLEGVVARLLRPGGRLILREFHPISTKLISCGRSGKHKVDGNYFDSSLIETRVAYSKYADNDSRGKVQLRKWGLGEVVTAMAKAGLHIVMLKEEPTVKLRDAGIPKTFIIVAEKL